MREKRKDKQELIPEFNLLGLCVPIVIVSSLLLWSPSITDDDDFLFNVETQHDTT